MRPAKPTTICNKFQKNIYCTDLKCKYLHAPQVCKFFLRNRCREKNCRFPHIRLLSLEERNTKENSANISGWMTSKYDSSTTYTTPVCQLHKLSGKCTREICGYSHWKIEKKTGNCSTPNCTNGYYCEYSHELPPGGYSPPFCCNVELKEECYKYANLPGSEIIYDTKLEQYLTCIYTYTDGRYLFSSPLDPWGSVQIKYLKPHNTTNSSYRQSCKTNIERITNSWEKWNIIRELVEIEELVKYVGYLMIELAVVETKNRSRNKRMTVLYQQKNILWI